MDTYDTTRDDAHRDRHWLPHDREVEAVDGDYGIVSLPEDEEEFDDADLEDE